MKMYVGNLPYSTGQAELQELFSPYGPVEQVHLVVDRVTNRPRGFAFITLSDQGRAHQAIQELNGRELGGRKIIVSEARPREERPRPHPSGGSGRKKHTSSKHRLQQRQRAGHNRI